MKSHFKRYFVSATRILQEKSEEYANSPVLDSQSILLEKPHGFWNDRKQQRLFFDKITSQLDLQEWKDWYRVTTKEVLKLGASPILNIYRNSLRVAIMSIYPEHPWEADKFNQKMSKNYWADTKNQRKFFDELYKTLGLKTWEDWYEVTSQDIQDNGGTGLLNHFNSSPMRALMYVYPEHSWKLHNFTSKLPPSYWKNKRHRKEFFEGLAAELRISTLDDWYPFTEETVRKNTPQELWKQFGGTHIFALMEAFPEHNWKLYNFSPRFPKGFFGPQYPQHSEFFLDHLAKQFDIKHWEDWYYVSIDDIALNHGAQLLRYHEGSLLKALMKYLPQYPWDLSKRFFLGKSQMSLLKLVRTIFPGEEKGDIFMNYMHPDLIFDDTSSTMELDIYLPRLQLAFEFQGEQHYDNFSMLGYDQGHNVQKAEACKRAGITLIPIPYWWDKSIESLKATIHQARPDLVADPGSGRPVPLEKEKAKRKRKLI